MAGTRADAEALRGEAEPVLGPMGLRLSAEKTRVSHIDEGFDFLGYRIRRDQKRGGGKRYVYTYPSKAALQAVKAKVRTISQQGRNLPLKVLLHRLNPVLRGWAYHFRYGVSSATFGYLSAFAWRRVIRWLCRKYPEANWGELRRRHLPGWWPAQDGGAAVQPPDGGDSSLPVPGSRHPLAVGRAGGAVGCVSRGSWRAGCGESRTSGSEARAGETDR